MSNSSANETPLLTVAIQSEQDVVKSRQLVRELAGLLKFDGTDQIRIVTALSEIVRNAYQYAGGGQLEIKVVDPDPTATGRPRQTLVMMISDQGPGIADLSAILEGRYRSATGLGMGILGARQFMDGAEFSTSARGTVVTLSKVLPPALTLRTAEELQQMARDVVRRTPLSPLQEVQRQNQELLQSLEDVRVRQDELSRLNQELTDTNTGVLALYDELETLHRITTMLASKLELRPLIQTIIEVTTSLTGAAQGAFFFRDEESGRWRFYASSGARGETFAHIGEAEIAAFMARNLDEGGIGRIPDTSEEPGFMDLGFWQVVGERILVRSCFTVPVVDQRGVILGAMVFVSARSNAFSERSERILTSVAAQAVVGIEKARLFHSVTAASEAKDQFLAMISHELRTPLTPVMAIISSLQDDPRVPPSLMAELAVVWRNIRLEARLIDDLLDFNRLIKGKMEIVTLPLDMHAVIEGVIGICREDLDAKDHRLTVELQAPSFTVQGDSARLQQVLWNVLKNAIKFTPTEGAIMVRSSVADGQFRVEVVDNGRGIEAEALERIFHAFDQGPHKLAAKLGGMGLGLAIARMFVTLHGGRIVASSEGLNRGSSFVIELPLVESVQPAPTPLPYVLDKERTQTGRILLVDDHADTLQALTRLLTHRGYEVTPVGNGAEARAKAAAEKFDLLLSDLGLPDCTGLELVRQIQAIRPLPAIAMSGYGMEADVANSTAAGFQAHLTKPVDFRELARLVERFLAPEAAEPAAS